MEIIPGVILVIFFILWRIWRTIPALNQPWRIVIRSHGGGYRQQSTVEIYMVRRFHSAASSSYSKNKFLVATLNSTDPDFDSKFIEAKVNARSQLRLVSGV